MKIAIIGFGVEGQAAYNYWRNGNDITVCDKKADVQLPPDVTGQLGDGYLENLEQFDLIVRSPFVRPDALINAASTDIIPRITSNTNEFMRVCPSRNIIGVTGTKGKGTTSTLIAKMLEAAGKRVHLGGNIGVPALSMLANNITPDDWVVLELSSFQLIDLKQSPHLAVCLMVAPEHLDWHISIEEYFAAKQNLFRRQTPDDLAVYYSDNERSAEIASAGQGVKLPYSQSPGAVVENNSISIDDHDICSVDDVKLRGAHNLQNVCAAVTVVWNVTKDAAAMKQALSEFTGLEHRLELVESVNNVQYFDDSFGTTPETATVAVEAFTQPKIVILGGSDKGADYSALAATIAKANMRAVLLIGEQAGRLQTSLADAGFTNVQPGGDTMQAIVETAASISQPGDVVLLSPGCASFDMFKNYKDRGDQFKTVVRSLAVAA